MRLAITRSWITVSKLPMAIVIPSRGVDSTRSSYDAVGRSKWAVRRGRLGDQMLVTDHRTGKLGAHHLVSRHGTPVWYPLSKFREVTVAVSNLLLRHAQPGHRASIRRSE